MKFKRILTKEQKVKQERKRFYEKVEALEEGRLSENGEVKIIERLLNNDEVRYLGERTQKLVSQFIEKGLVNI